MEVPQEAVNTLSDTAWGAIWLITVTGMGSAITYLIMTIRGNNKTILDLAEKRDQDSKDFGKLMRDVEKEALTAMIGAKEAVDDHKEATKALETELRDFKEKVNKSLDCRECPARARLSGGSP